jgi:hypothetical protein
MADLVGNLVKQRCEVTHPVHGEDRIHNFALSFVHIAYFSMNKGVWGKLKRVSNEPTTEKMPLPHNNFVCLAYKVNYIRMRLIYKRYALDNYRRFIKDGGMILKKYGSEGF